MGRPEEWAPLLKCSQKPRGEEERKDPRPSGSLRGKRTLLKDDEGMNAARLLKATDIMGASKTKIREEEERKDGCFLGLSVDEENGQLLLVKG